jgi:hypothetical protein
VQIQKPQLQGRVADRETSSARYLLIRVSISRYSAYYDGMRKIPTIQLRDFCGLLGIQDRQVRYFLERGFVPPGVEESPSTGNRREFGPGPAFWLAIAVLLRQNAIKASVAAEIAGLATEGVRMIAQNLSWDPGFLPLSGYFQTEHEYFLDVGDMAHVRILTDSNPSLDGLYQFGWKQLHGRSQVSLAIKPFVIVRLDLREIARLLGRVDGWNQARKPLNV